MNKYRYVRYTDDGCSLYQCLACMAQMEVRDDVQYWTYCPHCAVKWEGKHICRGHETPRWYFNKFGPDPEWGTMVRLFDGVYRVSDVMYRGSYSPPTHKWLFEWRSKWGKDEWGKWEVKASFNKEKLSESKWARDVLERMRCDWSRDDNFIQVEYRVRLVLCK